jgi:hypothetical protein
MKNLIKIRLKIYYLSNHLFRVVLLPGGGGHKAAEHDRNWPANFQAQGPGAEEQGRGEGEEQKHTAKVQGFVVVSGLLMGAAGHVAEEQAL